MAVVSPAIELVASRYDASGAATTTSAKVADCGINAACIIGRGVMAPNFGDPANLVRFRQPSNSPRCDQVLHLTTLNSFSQG